MSIAKSAMHLANGEKVEELDQYQPKKERKPGKKSEKTPATSTTHTHEDGETLQIREDKRNYRRHGEKNLSLIGRSLDDFGAGRSIVADNSGQVIGGNGTLREANKRGIPKRIIHTTGDELVVVVRDDIAPDDPRRQKLAIMDNSTTDTSEFEYMMLQEDFSLPELEDMGIDVPEDMLAIDDGGETAGETEPDAVPETPDDPVSVRGKVYQLGKHRLMCGDSTSAEDVDKLMQEEKADMVFTDPPWNVNYGAVEKGNAQGYKPRTIMNDFMGTEDFKNFMFNIFKQANYASKPGAMTYVVMSAQEWGNMMLTLAQNNYHWSSTIIWNKDSLVLSRKDYHTKYEPIWYGWKDGSRLCPLEDRKQSDVWDIPRPKKSDDHPTMKPVELVVRAIENSSKKGNVVLDLFGGSGTTIIASEATGRLGRSMELDPKYADVIRRRWAEFKYGEGCD